MFSSPYPERCLRDDRRKSISLPLSCCEEYLREALGAEKAAAMQQTGKWPHVQLLVLSLVWPKPLCRCRLGAGHALLWWGAHTVSPDAATFDVELAVFIQILILKLKEFSF